MLTVALQAGAATFFFFFFLTSWLLSLGFISICPHFASSCGKGVKAEMQTREENVCVFVFARQSERERED